jgi:hypothetical protein
MTDGERIENLIEASGNEDGHAYAWGGGSLVAIILIVILLILIF